ncbi:unnamed protein product, partial [Callosobruchus maculatus]
MTPSQRRNRNHAFAVIGEPSRPGSRSTSPTGRVSPFKGHGFNPAGSRHGSPVPPPDDARINATSPRHAATSRIPRRRGSNSFGERVYHPDLLASRGVAGLESNMSQSMGELRSSRRPPPAQVHRSPGKRVTYGKTTPAFQKLSPI